MDHKKFWSPRTRKEKRVIQPPVYLHRNIDPDLLSLSDQHHDLELENDTARHSPRSGALNTLNNSIVSKVLMGSLQSNVASPDSLSKPETKCPSPEHTPALFPRDLHTSQHSDQPHTYEFTVNPLSAIGRKRSQLIRPHSPVGDNPADTICNSPAINSPRSPSPRVNSRRILMGGEMQKVTKWLKSLENETKNFSSFSLYCDMLFRESAVLTEGKPIPNRLQTAIAFHCLCKSSAIFGRYEEILQVICHHLGQAIYVNHTSLPSIAQGQDIDALEYFAEQMTYFDSEKHLTQQIEFLDKELIQQKEKYEKKLAEEHAKIEKLQDAELRYRVRLLETHVNRKTPSHELVLKLKTVLKAFETIPTQEKNQVVLGVIEALNIAISSETIMTVAEHMDPLEKEKLLRDLFRQDFDELTEKVKEQAKSSAGMQQNTILERAVSRIAQIHKFINASFHPQQHMEASNTLGEDLCESDRKLFETVQTFVDDSYQEKQRNKDLSQRIDELTAQRTLAIFSHGAKVNELQQAQAKIQSELDALKEKLQMFQSKLDNTCNHIETQVNLGEEEEEQRPNCSRKARRHPRQLSRRRLHHKRSRAGGRGEEDDSDEDYEDEDYELYKGLTKDKMGIAHFIAQAKLPSNTIKKILTKRKPLTLNELHSIIVEYYQAKMFQDIQDDQVGKPRSNLAHFLSEMYMLHYGLKDLARSQLVFLDASIKKFARESPRVRLFGLLVGSLEPKRPHMPSVQAIDFFFFLLVVLFNAGVYKRGRQQIVHIAQKLKSFFGDGLFMGRNSVRVKQDILMTTLNLVFSFAPQEFHQQDMEKLKEELKQLGLAASCAAPNMSTSTGTPSITSIATLASVALHGSAVDLDSALERIMKAWFQLYDQQIQHIHGIFQLVDQNGDGTLDFQEFCEIVHILEPSMSRRDALSLYERAAGEDNVIDKDEFVALMLEHQRGVILKELYDGETHSQILSGIKQRKERMSLNALSTPSSSRQSTTSSSSTTPSQSIKPILLDPNFGTMQFGGHQHPFTSTFGSSKTSLDKEESYASLTAAMELTQLQLANMNPVDEEDDLSRKIREKMESFIDEDPEAAVKELTSRLGLSAANAGDEGQVQVPIVEENVSYSILSRLSKWTSESKDKLVHLQQKKQQQEEEEQKKNTQSLLLRTASIKNSSQRNLVLVNSVASSTRNLQVKSTDTSSNNSAISIEPSTPRPISPSPPTTSPATNPPTTSFPVDTTTVPSSLPTTKEEDEKVEK